VFSKLDNVFIPSLVNIPPQEELLTKHWKATRDEAEAYHGRVWEMGWIPHSLFPKLVVMCLRSFGWELTYWWQDGVLLTKGEQICILCCRPIDFFKSGIIVHLCGPQEAAAASYTSLVRAIEQEFSEKYTLHSRELIICPHCVSVASEITEDETKGGHSFTSLSMDGSVGAGGSLKLMKGKT
tara:strand:+ start:615 stop:1160 length:546 start_codon:yes stop_codon:yes gene_type:complete